jgi:hypothetical protein
MGIVCSLPACAQTPAAAITTTAAPVTTITLERLCQGCAQGSSLVLQRSGLATLTQQGNARQGLAERVARGRVRAEDFARLARLAQSLGFFEMDEAYQEPGLMDGAWSTISLSRGEQTKTVFRRMDAGPEGLKSLEQALLALQSRIEFTPDKP